MFERLKKSIQRKCARAKAAQVRNTSPATANVSAEPTGANIPWAELNGLLQPGSAVALPAVSAPVPMAGMVEAPEPLNPDERPIEFDEERRTDLSPRAPGRIAFLLRHETPAQTKARIENDWMRVAFKWRG
jgi:hypothetical protein